MPQNRILGYRARTRSKIVVYSVTIGILLVVLAAVQTSFFGRIRLFGAVPDLMLCTVLCVSYFCGRYAGGITGIAAGCLIEAIGSSGISILLVVYFLYGYLAGHFSRTVVPKRWTVYLFYLAVGVFLRAATTVVYTCMTYRTVDLIEIFLRSVLPEAVGTALAGMVLYVPIGCLCRLLERKNKQ